MRKKQNNHRFLLILAAVALMGLLTAGCSDDSSNPLVEDSSGSDQYEDFDFSKDYGGLTVSDETEAFEDEALMAMMQAEDDEIVDDPMAQDPEVLQWERMGQGPSDPENPNRPRFTYLTLRWGMIQGPDDTLVVDPEGLETLDWTGEIHTDRGLVVVKRVLAFERPGDHLVFPRLNPQTVAFVSHTRGHFDGLILQIIERPQDDEFAEPNLLHINTGPFAGEYPVSELMEMDELIDVDEAGNRLQLTGFTLSDIDYCPKGFLSGRYRVLSLCENEGEPQGEGEGEGVEGEHLGNFTGAWTDLTGRIQGFLRGGYGLDPEGNRIFVGKYIARGGQFRGLISGTWEPGEADDVLSSFTGQWVGRNGLVEGLLGGDAYPVEDYPGGFFAGRWTTLCDDEAEAKVLK